MAAGATLGRSSTVRFGVVRAAAAMGLGLALLWAPAGQVAAAGEVSPAAGAATVLAVSAPAAVTAGTSFSVKVTAKDSVGQVATAYRGRVAFTSSDPRRPVLPTAYTFTSTDNGVHTFTGVSLSAAGTRTITGTDTATTSIKGTTAGIAVSPAAATKFALSTTSPVTAGQAFALTVKAKDASDNVDPTYRGRITVTSTDPATPILVTRYTFTSTDNGIHVFGALTVRATGSRTIMAKDTAAASKTGTIAVTVVAPTSGFGAYAWGRNGGGELAVGNHVNQLSPTRIGTGTSWAQISAGRTHTAAVKIDGSLFTWGHNDQGQLGDGTLTVRQAPVRVGTGTQWAFVSAGWLDTLAIKKDGTLWAWGDNVHGQLGDGTKTRRLTPVQIGTDNRWTQVSASRGDHGFTLAVKSDGTLWGWGDNAFGSLGITGGEVATPTRVGTATNWIAVTTGALHTVALRSDGTLWAWGVGAFGPSTAGSGQVGTATDWASIAAGEGTSFATKTNGTLWAWGDNRTGQLGDGTTNNTTTPVRIGTDTHWSQVAAGLGHTVAVRSNATMWAWGAGGNGELGDGTGTTRMTPVQIGIGTAWASATAGIGRSFALGR